MNKLISFLWAIVIVSVLVTASELRPQGDINGNGIHNVYNFTNITAINFYGNGSALTGISSSGSSALNWTYLQNYPTACPAGTAVTTNGDSNTCTTFTQADQTLDTDSDVGFRNVSVTNCITFTSGGQICTG